MGRPSAIDGAYIRRHKLRGAIAKKAKISRQAVSLWHQVPLDHVQVVSDITGIPRHLIRPDIYKPPVPLVDIDAKLSQVQVALSLIRADLAQINTHRAKRPMHRTRKNGKTGS